MVAAGSLNSYRSKSRRYNNAMIPSITGEGFYEDLSHRFTRPKTASVTFMMEINITICFLMEECCQIKTILH